MAEESKPLWEQQAWDTEASFKCFRLWLFQDQRPRSLDAAYRAHVGRERAANGSLLRVADHAYRWYRGQDGKGKPRLYQGRPVPSWEERAKVYDAQLAELDRIQWEQRRAKLREQEWGQAQELLTKAGQMLQFPLQRVSTTEYYEDGRPKTIVVEPGRWSTRDAAALLKVASDLGRLAAEMVQITTEHRIVDLTADDLATARKRAQQFEDDMLNGNST